MSQIMHGKYSYQKKNMLFIGSGDFNWESCALFARSGNPAAARPP